MERATVTCHVQVGFTEQLSQKTDQLKSHQKVNSQQSQVERLFPEFFSGCNEPRFKEMRKDKAHTHLKAEQGFDPLIQSWLSLYGGSACVH